MEVDAQRVSTPLDDRIVRVHCHCGCHGAANLSFCVSCSRYHLVETRVARRASPFVYDGTPEVIKIKA